MNDPDKPGQADVNRPDKSHVDGENDLDRRARALEEALAARRPAVKRGDSDEQAAEGSSGFGQAIRLSSEFIAGIVTGAGLGWVIDNVAGTSPWGLIILLLLGFAAGVLNVMRATGRVAEPEMRVKPHEAGRKQDD